MRSWISEYGDFLDADRFTRLADEGREALDNGDLLPPVARLLGRPGRPA